ncbi:hypothetical protein N431DRAFT_323179 [Stipitochalara longipes BDJ]|nr:hypothetical protein N431DRAFT_323179 [Stipitochalara longipes BDJ]
MGSAMPLESIENHYGRNAQSRPNEYRRDGDAMSRTSQYNNRKENSPIKSDKPSPMTPSRKSSFSSQGGGQGSKRKNNNKRAQVSRQNSSTSAPTRPTPAATPIKLRPTETPAGPVLERTNAAEFGTDDADAPLATADMTLQCGSGEKVATEKSKRKQNKKKKNGFKNKDENATLAGASGNASFATEASTDTFEVISPVDTESSMGFTSKSTNTSFSTLPSRKPSVVSTNPSPPLSETPEEDDNITMKAMSPKTPDVDEKSVTPKLSQSQTSSKTPDTVSKHCSASDKTHSRRESVGSIASTASSSMRKADAKVAKSDVETESPESKINLDDQKEFPSLGPVRSPVSSIADGKRPAAHAATQRPPIIGSLNERVVSGSAKNLSRPAVPVVAVPRSYMQRQAPQP